MTQVKKSVDVTATMQEIDSLIAEIKIKTRDLARAPYHEKPKPLYELAHEALVKIGHPARTREILPKLRQLSGRRNLTPMLTYQALEYCKRHKGDVDRTNGVWEPVTRKGKGTH